MYALMPITNRRIVLGSASIFAVGLWYYAYYGDAVFLIPGFIGLALAPLLLAYRSWYVGRLMRDYQRVQS
jgi:uncharacterized membrane protein